MQTIIGREGDRVLLGDASIVWGSLGLLVQQTIIGREASMWDRFS